MSIPDPTDWLVTPDLTKPKEWKYPIDHKAIADMGKRVGRDHDVDTQRLKKAINGQTVALLLNGASIRELEEQIDAFASFDLCFMGINRFSGIEKRILNKAKRNFDIVFCMSEQEIPRRIGDIKAFLDRDENNLFMTTLCAMTWLENGDREWILDKGDKVYLMPRLLCRPAYPLSLEIIIDQLILTKVEHLILFGADGYYEQGMENKSDEELIRLSQAKMQETYYEPEIFKEPGRASGIGVGTVRFNNNFKYQPDKIKIVNCSPNSYYKHIPKASYAETLGALAVGGL